MLECFDSSSDEDPEYDSEEELDYLSEDPSDDIDDGQDEDNRPSSKSSLDSDFCIGNPERPVARRLFSESLLKRSIQYKTGAREPVDLRTMAPPAFAPNTISIATFHDILARYASKVPDALINLDVLRYSTIPSNLEARGTGKDRYLTKDEVVSLVEWKLKHGTFRPKLLSLVQSNEASLIETTTQHAFSLISVAPNHQRNQPAAPIDALPALKHLTTLRGIGPATASLLLSIHSPTYIPFFSDELFRWMTWAEPGKPGGWNRKIGYTNKEYAVLVQKAGEMKQKLDEQIGEDGKEVDMVDLERVAWVLGKEKVNIGEVDIQAGSTANTTTVRSEDGKMEGTVPKTAGASSKSAPKRKAETDSTEGLRRSSRRKVEL